MSRASSSLPGAQPAVKPAGTGCQRLPPLPAEDRRRPGQSCSGPSPNGAASRLPHTGHACTVGGVREMETITLLAWHPSQHPRNPLANSVRKAGLPLGWSFGCWVWTCCFSVGNPPVAHPVLGRAGSAPPRSEFGRNEEAKRS